MELQKCPKGHYYNALMGKCPYCEREKRGEKGPPEPGLWRGGEELPTGLRRCEKGHQYDGGRFDRCPVCAREEREKRLSLLPEPEGLVRCPNGHSYRGEMFSSCPYCTPGFVGAVIPCGKGHYYDHWHYRECPECRLEQMEKDDPQNQNKQEEEKMEIKNDLVMCPQGHYYNRAVHAACPICGGKAAGPTAGNFPPTENPSGSPVPPTGTGTNVQGNFPPTENPNLSGGAAGFSVGPTNPADPWNAKNSYASGFQPQPFGETQIGGDLSSAGQVDPVVGWLVCVDGPVRGTDWRLHAGYNYIGREVGDIHIQGDNQISREKHAMVAYHHKNRTYYVGPAEGRNIIEVNDEPVFNATKLNRHDIITIGTTKLLFVPLCGDDFVWDQEK